MSPLEWLRSRRQPRYATGGTIPGPTAGDAPLTATDTSCTLTMPTKPSTLPAGTLGVQTPEPAEPPQRAKPSYEHVVALIRQAETEIRAAREADEADLLHCPCGVIYSRCYYPQHHNTR